MHNGDLGASLEDRPTEYLPLFEKACKEVLAEDHQLDAGEERQFDDVQVRCSSMCVLHALCGEMGVTGTGS
eukprot:jgi/Chrzof1/12781/Cz07g07110.t1